MSDIRTVTDLLAVQEPIIRGWIAQQIGDHAATNDPSEVFSYEFTNLLDGDFLVYDGDSTVWRNTYSSADGHFLWYDLDGNGDLYLNPRNELYINAAGPIINELNSALIMRLSSGWYMSHDGHNMIQFDVVGQHQIIVNTYANFDLDFVIKTQASNPAFIMDGGLDAAAIGGAADGAYKLKVYGDVYYTGGLTVGGATTYDGAVIIDVTDTEALLVRKNADGGDVFTVDTDTPGIFVHGTTGIDYTVGADSDADLLTLSVTGTPKEWWDESENAFSFSTNIQIPTTTDADTGILKIGGVDTLHNYGGHNIFIGENPGNYTLTGEYNVGIGRDVLVSLTTAGANLAIGNKALEDLTEGSENVAMGSQALRDTTVGTTNMAIGSQALRRNIIGGGSVAIGTQALAYANANSNMAIGGFALGATTSGIENVAVGVGAARFGTTGDHNISIGKYSARYNVTGNDNCIIGHEAGHGVTTNSYSNNVFIGFRSGYAITTGSNNLLLGYQTGNVLTTGASNIIIGYDIDPSGAAVSDELNIGGLITGFLAAHASGPHVTLAGVEVHSYSSGIFIGSGAGNFTMTGTRNVALGVNALVSVTSGYSNVAIGEDALTANTTAYGNMAIGYGAGESLTTGRFNVAIGGLALQDCEIGLYNFALGSQALQHTTAGENIGIGYTAGRGITSGSKNVFIGTYVGVNGTSAWENIGMGWNSLGNLSTGDRNICIGHQSGDGITTGAENILIGHNARTTAGGGTGAELNIGDTLYGRLVNNNNITINAPTISAHYDLMLAGDGVLGLKETATPTADANYGKVYCKNDDKLYFQDGAGAEHEIAFV